MNLVEDYREVLFQADLLRKAVWKFSSELASTGEYPEDVNRLNKFYDSVADEYYKHFKLAAKDFRNDRIICDGINPKVEFKHR